MIEQKIEAIKATKPNWLDMQFLDLIERGLKDDSKTIRVNAMLQLDQWYKEIKR